MKFLITGPTLDIGLRGPSSNPVYNQGTIRIVAPTTPGGIRTLQSNLVVDLEASQKPWTYFPPVPQFILFDVMDMEWKKLLPTQSMRGPNAPIELTVGSNPLFLCKNYGLDAFNFPETLTTGTTPRNIILRWSINPAIVVGEVSTGELITGMVLQGNDHGLIDPVTWAP